MTMILSGNQQISLEDDQTAVTLTLDASTIAKHVKGTFVVAMLNGWQEIVTERHLFLRMTQDCRLPPFLAVISLQLAVKGSLRVSTSVRLS
jgi:hypothetical protein